MLPMSFAWTITLPHDRLHTLQPKYIHIFWFSGHYSCLCSPLPWAPSLSFRLALCENESMNTMASTIQHSMTSLSTFLRISGTIWHRKMWMIFLIGGIGTSYHFSVERPLSWYLCCSSTIFPTIPGRRGESTTNPMRSSMKRVQHARTRLARI